MNNCKVGRSSLPFPHWYNRRIILPKTCRVRLTIRRVHTQKYASAPSTKERPVKGYLLFSLSLLLAFISYKCNDLSPKCTIHLAQFSVMSDQLLLFYFYVPLLLRWMSEFDWISLGGHGQKVSTKYIKVESIWHGLSPFELTFLSLCSEK